MMDCERAWPEPPAHVKIRDRFWNLYVKNVSSKMIPYQWRVLNDIEKGTEKSGCIRNFRIAAGEESGEFHGFVFQDTDLAKWLEAVAYSLSLCEDPVLEEQADSAIDLIGRAQRPDGYLNTYFTIKEPHAEFTNLREGHELYTAGHMMEAACAYYESTGKDKFLNICRKLADHICRTFHEERYLTAVPGHQEIELGLIRMYRVTGEVRYLDMAREFIDRRGVRPNYLVHEHERDDWTDVFMNRDAYFPSYAQCDEPVREQKTARGHAVRAMYMYSAMADLAYEYEDEELLDTCRSLYDDVTCRQMYLTGGIGSSGLYERFTTGYDLPNDRNYAESCASIGLAMFTSRMAQITHEEKYISTMETALYNTIAAATALSGDRFFYVNPLEVWPKNCLPYTSMAHVKPVRQKWFGCACCPPNLARTYAQIGSYICYTDKNHVWINLHAGAEIDAELEESKVHISVQTEMPFYGETIITVESNNAQGTIMLRIPEYAEEPRITYADGTSIIPKSGAYAPLPVREGKESVTIHFEMPAHFVYADPRVRADAGKVAVVKGPLVYASEEVDNGENLASYVIDTSIPLIEEDAPDLPEGCRYLVAHGEKMINKKSEGALYSRVRPETEPAKLRLIPYCFWGNRQPGEMMVWHREKR